MSAGEIRPPNASTSNRTHTTIITAPINQTLRIEQGLEQKITTPAHWNAKIFMNHKLTVDTTMHCNIYASQNIETICNSICSETVEIFQTFIRFWFSGLKRPKFSFWLQTNCLQGKSNYLNDLLCIMPSNSELTFNHHVFNYNSDGR